MGEMGWMGEIAPVRSNDFSRCTRVMAPAITRAIPGFTRCLLGNWSDRLIWGRYEGDRFRNEDNDSKALLRTYERERLKALLRTYERERQQVVTTN
ncbi:MAG: hypothetical protein ACRC8Y_17405 [Chroococcales cyanobacterium]